MASLFHLLFELARITILSFIYGGAIWLVLSKLLRNKTQYWKIVPFLFLALFIWRFSYWRNNGLGDHGRVPINTNYEVSIMDFAVGNIEERKSNSFPFGQKGSMDELYLDNGYIYGHNFDGYVVFDIKYEEIRTDLSINQFRNMGGEEEKLLSPSKFHYDYWGWKTLLFL